MMASTSSSPDPNIKLASIITLGFLCEDLDPGFFGEQVLTEVLGAVLTNIS
jgi:hypothetical protein